MTDTPTHLETSDVRMVNLDIEGDLIPVVAVVLKQDDASEILEFEPHGSYVVENIEKPETGAAGVTVSLRVIHHTAFPDEESMDHYLAHYYAQHGEPTLDENGEKSEEYLTAAAAAMHHADLTHSATAAPRPDEENDFQEGHCTRNAYEVIIPEAYVNIAYQLFEAENDSKGLDPRLTQSSFIFITEDQVTEERNREGYTFEHVTGSASFYKHGSPDYVDSTGELSNLFRGEYIIKPSRHQMGTAISTLLSLISRLAAGDVAVLDEIDDLMDPITQARASMSGDTKRKPLSQDATIHGMLHALSSIYESTSPEALFDTLAESQVLNGFEDTVETLFERSEQLEQAIQLENIFNDNGFDEMFKELGVSLPSSPLTIPDDATETDFANFYSTPLTLNTYPEKMRAIANLMELPLLEEYDFMDNRAVEDLEMKSADAAQLFKTMLIVLAVRLERLTEMRDYGLPFTPVNVIFHAVESAYGSTFGEDVFIHGLLNASGEGREVLRILMEHTLPTSIDSRQELLNIFPENGPEVPFFYSLTTVRTLHSIIHFLMDQEPDLQTLAVGIHPQNPLREFILSYKERLEEAKEDAEEEGVDYSEHSDLCLAYDLAATELSYNEATSQELTDGILNILSALSMAKASDDMTSDELYDMHDSFYIALARHISGW